VRARQPNSASQSPVWLGINVSAAYGPAKCWPLERFAAVTRLVSEKVPNCVWLSFGSGRDWVLGERLASMGTGSVANLAGKTSLRQLMALLRICNVLLSNDSGPMHVAAALGVPVVVPFGSTSPELTGPGLPGDRKHHLLRGHSPCAPCFRRTCPIDFRCMNSISVEQVAAAVIESLSTCT
jgi:heptosyltransferase-2